MTPNYGLSSWLTSNTGVDVAPTIPRKIAIYLAGLFCVSILYYCPLSQVYTLKTLLIELRKTSNSQWVPIGVASVPDGTTGTSILDTIRIERPLLADHAIRVKRFVRVPGVFDDTDNPATGRILYIDDTVRNAPI